jgi:hypothetical protein
MSMRLKKFDMSRLKWDSVVVLLGKRNTGKSFLTKDILYHHKDIPVGTIISPSEGANKFYAPLVPEFFIHEEYTPSLISRVIKRQQKAVGSWQKDRSLDPRSFLVFDDCMYDNSWKSDKNVRLLFMNGRHYKMLFLITMQFPLGIPPVLRTNVDFVFILRENFISNRKRIYEHWAGMFPDFKTFGQVMDQCTENFECLVIDNTSKSNKLEDVIYWYKASNHENFRLGAPIFWSMAARYPNKKKKDEEAYPYGNEKKNFHFKVQKVT